MNLKFWRGNFKGRDHFENQNVDGEDSIICPVNLWWVGGMN